MPEMGMPEAGMLEIAVKHQFGGFGLDVAFAAPAGLTAIFGQSGAGKTTLIQAVAGLLRADQARVMLGGEDLARLAVHKRRIGYVFQEARLFPHLSVRGNLGYGRWFRPKGRADFARVVGLLGLEGLLERQPGKLSGGEKQRVAIGRALLSDPRLLIMDEPLSALDAARKAEILPYLERLRDEAGVPILYVSHAVAEVARLATTVVVLEAGRLRRIGAAAEVLSDPEIAPVLGLREAGALISARLVAQEADGLSRLETAAGPVFLPRVAAGLGAELRLRILAQDVMIALARPEGISALNVLAVRVRAIRQGEGPGALVTLDLGAERLLARVTRRSVAALGLAEGQEVFAVLKSVALAQGDIGVAEIAVGRD
jgi:molybdate transport system ATP-binding protein